MRILFEGGDYDTCLEIDVDDTGAVSVDFIVDGIGQGLSIIRRNELYQLHGFILGVIHNLEAGNYVLSD